MCQKCDNLNKQIPQCHSELSKICPAILVQSIHTKIKEVNSKPFKVPVKHKFFWHNFEI